MTHVSTGGPYITIEEHERRMEAMQQVIDHLQRRVAQLEKQYVCKDGKVEPGLKVDTFSGKLIPWSDEQEAFFEPWSKLGLDGKIPLEPGEGWEFVPHGSRWEEGDEYWAIWNLNWTLSHNRNTVISSPGKDLGPYRRKIKPVPPVPEPSSSARMLWYTRGHWTFRVCPVTGTHIRWTEDLETFFKPWMDLGVMDKVPLVPGEGWEFVPHGSRWEEGDECWIIWYGQWSLSHNHNTVISSPRKYLGPYRRRIKGRWHTPMGSPPGTQVLLDKPVKQEPTQLPDCPKCGGKPMLLVENRGMKNKHSWVQCTECKSRTVVRSIEALSVRDWKNGDIWSEPATGESPPISPEAAPDHGPVDIDGTKLVPGTRVLVHFSEGTREGVVVRPFPEQPTSHQAGCWVDVSVEGKGPEGIPSYILEVVREVCCDDSIIPATPSAAVVASDPVAECSSCRGEGGRPDDVCDQRYTCVRCGGTGKEPEDWVALTDPEHIARSCDECRREEIKCDWAECFGMVGERIGDHPEWQFRCRRKDLPVKEADLPPVSVVPKTRTVTLREYLWEGESYWTDSLAEIGYTGRTCQTEVPE